MREPSTLRPYPLRPPSVQTPLVSVVMAVHNEADDVRSAVDSILTQSWRDLELIVVDDGSTDGTREVLRTVEDKRVIVIERPHAGLAASLNAGIGVACGELVARQDGDDVSLPARLERQVAYLDAHPEVVAVGCRTAIVGARGERLLELDLPTDATAVRDALLGQSRPNPLVHGAVMFRRRCAAEAGLYRPEFQKSQDIDLWLRMAESGHIANIDEVLYEWRLRPGSSGAGAWSVQRDYSYLARRAAWARIHGLPEVALDVGAVRRPSRLASALRRAHGTTLDADLAAAKLLFIHGRSRAARRYAFAASRRRPVRPMAWAILILALLPRNSGARIWGAGRRVFRRLTWLR